MLVLLACYASVAMVAPALVRWLGPKALYAVAVLPAATFAWALSHAGAMRSGGAVSESYPWVPQLGQELSFRMTTFPWVMVLLVSGIGALVLIYSAHYFSEGEIGLGRFAAVFVGFAGAMFGLVVSDDLLLLYVFWELTSVFSYLLIGHDPAKRASRWAAMQALLVTTFGGLAMLVGFIMLGEHAGTYRISEVIDQVPGGAYLVVALVMILLGALSKSAVFPFSFWLPNAMAAPTPVSAYLHAAAMVKAGVFLIGMLTPVFASDLPWQQVIWVCGSITFLFGGWTALRQTDLKLMLAYGTISQLGMISIVLGSGFRTAALAGAALLAGHALFKASLFLVVGIVDKSTGTREIYSLSGLGARRPALAAVAIVAVASMVGLPPTLGFVAKEAMLEAFWDGGAGPRAMLIVLVAGSALTVGYGMRFLWGAFATKPDYDDSPAEPVGFGFLASPALLALAGLGAGLLAAEADGLLAPYADLYPAGEHAYHLALWHGITPALGLSVIALSTGFALYLTTRRTNAWRAVKLRLTSGVVYRHALGGLDRSAIELTGRTQRGSLPFYLGVILVTLVVFAGGLLVFNGPWPFQARLFDTPLQLAAGGVIVAAAITAAIARRRLTAMILTGVSGYGVALLFIIHGAPDLALTQFLVETVTIVMFVLVLRRLPARFSERPLKKIRRLRVTIGIAVGVVAACMSWVAVNGRQAESISTLFPDLAVSYGGGHNVVNVTLVDIRAWDTMGEIAVLLVAATGVASLIFGRDRAMHRRGGSRPAPPKTGEHVRWLARPETDGTHQAIILQVVTRLLFHTIILFSIYLLFSGHNDPGGGFAGGLVAGLALAVRYLAGGRAELNAAAPIDAGRLLGTGLLVAVGTGAVSMLLGGTVLQSAILHFELPLIGDLHFVTSAFFDIGVYLIVVGLVLDILRSLGAEIDRHRESGDEPETQPTLAKEAA
ncbi:Na+/H+ antiporter subunit A [Glycomyces sp. NRRL B-16210]|uniref:Na+/H+ antiporter subunit A n=1 Tax=Glycomyces sp. NRRL B-16210 TaxID=1463821 RepID=UPI0004C06447|nr:Na+/H+ antiporter subunit A [Glycomyces sp. NRRL B-16210]